MLLCYCFYRDCLCYCVIVSVEIFVLVFLDAIFVLVFSIRCNLVSYLGHPLLGVVEAWG